MKKTYKDAILFAKKFDEYTINNKIDELKILIDNAINTLDKGDIIFQTYLLYSIATAKGTIYQLTKDENKDKENSLKEQLYYYRRSIDNIEREEYKDKISITFGNVLIASIYVNYGNCLGECGRIISSINQYNKALEYIPDYAMAIGNLGGRLMEYGMLLTDGQEYIRDCLNRSSINYLETAINSKDSNCYIEAKMAFIAILSKFHIDYREYLSKPINMPPINFPSKRELTYRIWCMKNNLFLSPLNDISKTELSWADDRLYISKILTSTKDYLPPISFGIFNQLKQEFIFARYLFYEAITINNKTHFADKKTYVYETLDYSLFSLRIEKLKSSFKTLYGILDKTSYLLNDYFDLGIHEKDVNFYSIWLSEKKGKNGYKYKNTLNYKDNYALQSLYWISKDFSDKFAKDINPLYKELKDIRNSLEHKYTAITMLKSNDVFQNREKMYCITENDFINKTITLFQVVRETIISLELAININEKIKYDNIDYDTKIANLTIKKINDNWKI